MSFLSRLMDCPFTGNPLSILRNESKCKTPSLLSTILSNIAIIIIADGTTRSFFPLLIAFKSVIAFETASATSVFISSLIFLVLH